MLTPATLCLLSSIRLIATKVGDSILVTSKTGERPRKLCKSEQEIIEWLHSLTVQETPAWMAIRALRAMLLENPSGNPVSDWFIHNKRDGSASVAVKKLQTIALTEIHLREEEFRALAPLVLPQFFEGPYETVVERLERAAIDLSRELTIA